MWPRRLAPRAPLGSPSESRGESAFVVSPLRDQAVRLERRTNAAQVELRLRHLVAETLGISADELAAPVSLVDDLAVDSLDLLELANGIEEALAVSLPERLLAAVRTYGDLAALVVDRVPCPATTAEEPVLVRARITPPGSRLGRTIVRVLVLSPYAIPGGSREPVLARLRATFGDLAACGIDVDVSRDGRWHTGGAVQHPR